MIEVPGYSTPGPRSRIDAPQPCKRKEGPIKPLHGAEGFTQVGMEAVRLGERWPSREK